MRMCRLEVVECEFSGVGCDGMFRREDQEEHIRQNNKKHLAMTATTSVKMNQKLLEQEKELQEQAEKLHEQEEKLQEQEEKLQEQEEKLQEQAEQIQKVRVLLQEHEKKFVRLEEKSVQNEGAVDEVTNFINLKRRFEMENFSLEKVKDVFNDWKSPAMYTHMCGYKFCIGIAANVRGATHGKAMSVYLYAMQGEYEQQLKWPARVSFTFELLHRHGGLNIMHTHTEKQWQKPTRPCTAINYFARIQVGNCWAFLEHSKLADFLYNDSLYFHLSNITVY